MIRQAREFCASLRVLAGAAIDKPRWARISMAARLAHAGVKLVESRFVRSVDHFVDSADGDLLVSLPDRSLCRIRLMRIGVLEWSIPAAAALDRIEWAWRMHIREQLGEFDAAGAVAWRGTVNLEWIGREVWRRTQSEWPEASVVRRVANEMGIRQRSHAWFGIGCEGNRFVTESDADRILGVLIDHAQSDPRLLDPSYRGIYSLRQSIDQWRGDRSRGGLPSPEVIRQLCEIANRDRATV